MEIKVESRSLRDVVVLVPDVFQDSRGFFMETYREDKFHEPRPAVSVCAGQSLAFGTRGSARVAFSVGTSDGKADACHSRKRLSGRRGHPQRITNFGKVGRRGSFGRKQTPSLGPGRVCQRLLCTFRICRDPVQMHRHLQQQAESGILWNDPEIGIEWPLPSAEIQLSEKDKKAQTLAQWLASPNSSQLQVLNGITSSSIRRK